jgi:hypothetical protein
MSDLDEINHIVTSILKSYPQEEHWPSNITDQVFLAIEKNTYVYLKQYKILIGPEGKFKEKVNQQIGRSVKDYTGLKVINPHTPAVLSKLITIYSELG